MVANLESSVVSVELTNYNYKDGWTVIDYNWQMTKFWLTPQHSATDAHCTTHVWMKQ